MLQALPRGTPSFSKLLSMPTAQACTPEYGTILLNPPASCEGMLTLQQSHRDLCSGFCNFAIVSQWRTSNIGVSRAAHSRDLS